MLKKSKKVKNNQRRRAKKSSSFSRRLVKSLIFTLTLVVVVFALLMAFLMKSGGTGAKKDVKIEIPTGATSDQIADILDKEGVVFSGDLFKIYMRVVKHSPIQAGTYQLTTASGFDKALNDLQDKKHVKVNVLLLKEGQTLEQMAEAMAAYFNLSKQDVMDQLTDPDFVQECVAKYPKLLSGVKNNQDVRYQLEGYLFPATYEVKPTDSLKTLVDKMLQESEKIRQKYASTFQGQDLTWHQILTLASIIEREASSDEDRQMVSGVFYNRLEAGMPLQSDVTLLYAHKAHLAYVTEADTQIDSPYNLYTNKGLGPGPFNSPSESSIRAALSPKKNNYFFFVANLDTKKVYYSKTYEEHEALVKEHVSEDNAKYNH